VSLVAVAARVSGVVLSPQVTVKEDMVPSGSVAEKVTATSCPVLAGFGITLLTVIVGGLSFTVSIVVPEPGPVMFVAVTIMVNILLVTEPVEV
jgi:hypothetical protein